MIDNEANNARSFETLRTIMMFLFMMMLFGSLQNDNNSANLRDSSEEMKARQLMLKMKQILGYDLAYSYNSNSPYAMNISGTYYGNYKRVLKSLLIHTDGDYNMNIQFINKRFPNVSPITSEEGTLEIKLWDTLSDVNYLHFISSDITFITKDGKSNNVIHMTGFYFVPTGHLTMISNISGGRKVIQWKNPYMNEKHTTTSNTTTNTTNTNNTSDNMNNMNSDNNTTHDNNISIQDNRQLIDIHSNSTSSIANNNTTIDTFNTTLSMPLSPHSTYFQSDIIHYDDSIETLNRSSIRSMIFPSRIETSEALLKRCYYKFDSTLLSSIIDSTIHPSTVFTSSFISKFFPYPKDHYLNATGGFMSTNCNISYEYSFEGVTTNTSFILSSSQLYSFVMVMITFVIAYLLIVELDNISSTSQQEHTSSLTVFAQCLIDCIISLYHLGLSIISPSLFGDFTALVMQSFFLAVFLELRVYLIVWKNQNPELFEQGWQRVNKELSWLYLKLYGCICLGMIVLYYRNIFTFIFLWCLSLFWLPQILLCMKEGHRPSFSNRYIIFISLCRSFIPVYLLLYPYNIYLLYFKHPVPTLPLVLILVNIAIQTIILLYQKKYGVYSVLPSFLRPQQYNYHRIPSIETSDDVECTICMCSIDLNTVLPKTIMVTPCNHIFHTDCLSHWMEIKQDCPVCRAKLPDVI